MRNTAKMRPEYPANTPAGMAAVLERARSRRLRVRITYRSGEVLDGYVGLAHGPTATPLLVHNKRSLNGNPINVTEVVTIAHANMSKGGVLWPKRLRRVTNPVEAGMAVPFRPGSRAPGDERIDNYGFVEG